MPGENGWPLALGKRQSEIQPVENGDVELFHNFGNGLKCFPLQIEGPVIPPGASHFGKEVGKGGIFDSVMFKTVIATAKP